MGRGRDPRTPTTPAVDAELARTGRCLGGKRDKDGRSPLPRFVRVSASRRGERLTVCLWRSRVGSWIRVGSRAPCGRSGRPRAHIVPGAGGKEEQRRPPAPRPPGGPAPNGIPLCTTPPRRRHAGGPWPRPVGRTPGPAYPRPAPHGISLPPDPAVSASVPHANEERAGGGARAPTSRFGGNEIRAPRARWPSPGPRSRPPDAGTNGTAGGPRAARLAAPPLAGGRDRPKGAGPPGKRSENAKRSHFVPIYIYY